MTRQLIGAFLKLLVVGFTMPPLRPEFRSLKWKACGPKQVCKSFVTLARCVVLTVTVAESSSVKPLHLSTRQRRQLEKQLRNARDVRVYRRTLAVLEYDRGRSVTEISRSLHVSRPSIYRWIERYTESSDPESLEDHYRSGRTRAWTEDCSDLLQSFLERSPAELGYFAVNWNIPLLRDPLEICTGLKFSEDTIRRALHRLNYVWKRPRYELAPDPEREKKTPHSPQNQAFAASQRDPGRGRNGSAAVSAAPCELGAARTTNAGAHLRKERSSGRLRCDEPSHWKATVSCP